MRKTLFICLTVILFTLQAYAAEYKIDTDHSQVGFRIKHLAISMVPGRFGQFSGTFSFDPAKIDASKVATTISVQSINTDNQKRDDHLRNPDFFDAAKYPDIKYTSAKVEPTGKDSFIVHGDLSMHGVTKHVMLNVTYHGAAKDPWGNERTAFSATTRINRKDFGLVWNKVLETGGLVVGEDVEITLDIEGVKQS